jgi:hypothetical protein
VLDLVADRPDHLVDPVQFRSVRAACEGSQIGRITDWDAAGARRARTRDGPSH